MSWATCYSGSNNIHFNLPPLMSDGRQYSQYDPGFTADSKLKDNLGIKNNYNYRQWLIHNGNKVIQKNKALACNESSECIAAAKMAGKTEKYLFKSCADKSTPYGYETSDLKNLYLSRQELNAKLNTPIMTQEQLLLARSGNCALGDANGSGPMKSCSSNKFN